MMFTHASIRLDIARQRQQDALARADRYRLGRALRADEMPQLGYVARLAALAQSALRRSTPVHRTVRARPGEADA